MDIVYPLGEASAADIRGKMADPPSYSAVRALLRVLEDKGHLTHDAHGNRYVYRATRSRAQASRAALSHVVQTFFEGSAVKAAAALLQSDDAALDAEQLGNLEALIQAARNEGR